MPVTKTCERCGRTYQVKRYKAAMSRHCSLGCVKNRLSKACEVCDKVFEVKAYRRESAKTCSFACASILKRKGPTAPEGMKWCNTGQHFKPFRDFPKCSKASDGLYHKCRECHSAYYVRNAETINEKNKTYRTANREHLIQKGRERWGNNRERYTAQKRAYWNKKKYQINAARKERNQQLTEAERVARALYHKLRYQRQRDVQKEKVREYYKKNRWAWKASGENRRARKKGAPGSFTSAQWLAKLEFWGWRCYLCRTPLEGQEIHVEHRKPLCRGGSNWPANLAPACKPCNQSKGRKTESEYRALLSMLAKVA